MSPLSTVRQPASAERTDNSTPASSHTSFKSLVYNFVSKMFTVPSKVVRKTIASIFPLRALLKLIVYIFRFPIHRFISQAEPLYTSYTINGRTAPSAEPIFFTTSESTGLPLCIKRWGRYDEFANIEDVSESTKLLLDGLAFNRKFAPRVCLGIVPFKEAKNPEKLERSLLIINPREQDIVRGRQYGLLMIRLREKWRLDQLLHAKKGGYGTDSGMEFLAAEIARMHKKVDSMYERQARPGETEIAAHIEHIHSKLTFNIDRFEKVLDYLEGRYDHLKAYRDISRLMQEAGDSCTKDFEQRYKEGHVKRCHGDLKITNLWIPDIYLFIPIKRLRKHLFALDCVDFNRDFCYIDTLSDVAMLTVDLEMQLSTQFKSLSSARHLTSHFLDTFLKKAQEKDANVRLLLEYYITEKAMVRTYMCILYDIAKIRDHHKRISAGKKYLEVALYHAERLRTLLKEAKEVSFR